MPAKSNSNADAAKEKGTNGNSGNANGKASGPSSSDTDSAALPDQTTPAKGTIRVAVTNAAAKDDLFTAENTEWLAETGDLTGALDVLANDPGSARLVAVHGAMPEGSGMIAPNTEATLTIEHDGAEYEAALSINPDGTVQVDLSGLEGNLALAEGETLTATFYYTAQMGRNGVLSTAAVTIELTGEDTPATISGEDTGTVQEDGTLDAAGTLLIDDPDAGEAAFAAPDDAALVGVFGDFTFDPDSGAWTYALRNDAENVQALNTGEFETDTLTVTSIDGTAHDIVITVQGADEPVEEEPAQLANPGFENGLEGFTVLGSTGAVAGGSGIDPTEGTQMAGLSTEPDFTGDPATTEDIETDLGLAAGSLTSLGNGEASGGSAVQTNLFLSAGQTVTFDYRFTTQEDGTANDFAFVSVDGAVEELTDVEDVGALGDSGWQTYSYTATEDGNVDIAVGVIDAGDDFGTSSLFVDNFTIA